jgi:hypothetical protein
LAWGYDNGVDFEGFNVCGINLYNSELMASNLKEELFI